MTELEKAVYETLKASNGPMQIRDIYANVKNAVPHLCDDSKIPCQYCQQNHPLWQHQTAWAIQSLKGKKLVRSTQRGYWELIATQKDYKPTQVKAAPGDFKSGTVHSNIKRKIKEIGQILGRYAKEEYQSPPYIYDVVWKEDEGLPRPCHVFEVQDKGAVDSALSKLQHARDIWKPKLFLVVTGEKDRKKVDMLLKPFLSGTFHGINKDTIILTSDVIDEIYESLNKNREVVRHFLEG